MKVGASVSTDKQVERTLVLSIKVIRTDRLQSIGIHLTGKGILLQRKKMSIKPDDIGIRSGSIRPKNLRIVGIAITVSSEHSFSSRPFTHESLSSDPTILEIDVAVFDAESADSSVSVEVVFLHIRYFRKKTYVFKFRHDLRIWSNTVESAVNRLGDFSINDQIKAFSLESTGCFIT